MNRLWSRQGNFVVKSHRESPIAKAPKHPHLIVPNPNLRLLDQVRATMRLKHYSLSTERSYCDWIRRHIRFHRMKSRDDLFVEPEARIELFLSHLAVNGNVFELFKSYWATKMFRRQ